MRSPESLASVSVNDNHTDYGGGEKVKSLVGTETCERQGVEVGLI